MKTVIKYWIKDKKAFLSLLTYVILFTIQTVISTRILLLITTCIAEFSIERFYIILLNSIILILLNFGQGYFSKNARNSIIQSVDEAYTEKILTADVSLFTKKSTSKILTLKKFEDNISRIGMNSSQILHSLIQIVANITAMYILCGVIIIPIIAIYILSSLVLVLIYKKLASLEDKSTEIVHDLNQETENIVNGFEVVRSFNTIKNHRKKLKDLTTKLKQIRSKKSKFISILFGVAELIERSVVIVVLLYTSSLISKGEIDVPTAISTLMYAGRLIEPLFVIIELSDSFSEELALAKEFEEVMNYKNITDGDIELTRFNNEIEINNVSFSYSSTSDVINNICMKIHKAEKIGICGSSGGGKSTLIKLLNRFYDTTSGEITIDGTNINKLTRESYFRKVGSIQQDPVIFQGTIKENIMYGSLNSLDIEIIDAAKKSNIYDFIMSLPEKFDTQVGPKGLKLSAGQKQRIALARLFLKNPDIILLDEATSALDNESESIIQESLEKLKDKTVITVAHRLSTIRNCDKIFVIGNNKILESGSHNELVEKRGEYYKLLK